MALGNREGEARMVYKGYQGEKPKMPVDLNIQHPTFDAKPSPLSLSPFPVLSFLVLNVSSWN